MLDYE